MTTIEQLLAARNPLADWERCKSYIETAIGPAGTHSIEDVAADVAKGAAHFWPGAQSAAVTEVHKFPKGSALHIFAAGGELQELIDMVPSFASWGRFLGCSALTLTGRDGWERVLKPSGWTKRAVVLSRPISPEQNSG